MKLWKTILALLVIAALTLGTSLAETDDPEEALAIWRANTTVYDVTDSEATGSSWLASALSVADRSFVHKYESSTRYSSTKFFLNLFDYKNNGNTDNEPEIMITYCRDDAFLNINTVSIVFNGKSYDFSGRISHNTDQDEKGYTEFLHIYFDLNSFDFISDLMNYMTEVGGDDILDAIQNDRYSATLILHGDEDVSAQLGSGFFLDFFVVLAYSLSDYNYINHMPSTGGVTLTISNP